MPGTIFVVLNRHVINANRKLPMDERKPAIRVSRGKHGKPVYCDSFVIHGESRLINGLGEPVMPCGATIAISTEASLTLITRGEQVLLND